MARLPISGGDKGKWGTILNDFLNVGHKSDGNLKGIQNAFNVKDYGAKGDGTTDDTTAIQAAIDSISSTDGGILYIPTGDYVCTSSLTVHSNLYIFGAGESTFIDFTGLASTKNGFEFDGVNIDDFRISDMRIRGASLNDGDDTAGNAIYIKTSGISERVKIHNVRIERWRKGVTIDSAAATVTENPEIVNCFIDECSRAAIFLRRCHWSLVEGNTIDSDRTGIGDAAASLIGIWEAEGKFSRIANNSIRGGLQETILVSSPHTTVIGNTIENPGASAIVIETKFSATVKADGKMYCSIIGNTIKGTSTDAISLRHDPANNTVGAGYNVVSGNTVLGTARGVRVGLPGASTQVCFDNVISNNMLIDIQTNGIEVDDSENTVLSGNMIINSKGIGIRIQGTAKNTNVFGGYINDTTNDGIGLFDTVSNTLIVGVMFRNCARYGVHARGSSDLTNVVGCSFVDDQGTATMIRGVFTAESATNVRAYGNFDNGMTNASSYSLTDWGAKQETRVVTLADDGTPTVANVTLAKTGGTTTITDFDEGIVGQTFTLLSGHAVTITNNTNILLNGSVNFVMAVGDSLTLTMFNNEAWEEVSRKTN